MRQSDAANAADTNCLRSAGFRKERSSTSWGLPWPIHVTDHNPPEVQQLSPLVRKPEIVKIVKANPMVGFVATVRCWRHNGINTTAEVMYVQNVGLQYKEVRIA